jgi:hypothetical protein
MMQLIEEGKDNQSKESSSKPGGKKSKSGGMDVKQVTALVDARIEELRKLGKLGGGPSL